MKRSTAITLLAIGAGAVVLEAAFGSRNDEDSPSEAGTVFNSKEQCAASGSVSKQDCERGWTDAQKDHEANAPHYASTADCEQVYGVGKCITPTTASGSVAAYVIPAMMGYMIGRSWSSSGCRAAPLFRRPGDPKDQYQFSTGPCPAYRSATSTTSSSGGGSHYYGSTRTYTRSTTTRGGFGSTGRGFFSSGS